MSITITVNDLCELTKANEESKELWRKKYKKIKKLFKLVRECKRGDKAFNLNVEEVYETYNKLKEAYEETKELEQKHIDLHEKMIESCNRRDCRDLYEAEALSVFNDSISELRCSYLRVLDEMRDRNNYFVDCLTDKEFETFKKEFARVIERIEEIANRTNEEVKKILNKKEAKNLLYNKEAKKILDELDKEDIQNHIRVRGTAKLYEMYHIAEALSVFNDSASEVRCSYLRVLDKTKDRNNYFLEEFVREIERIEEIVNRTNEEVKKILDELGKESEDIIRSGVMIELHGRALEEIKSSQSLIIEMLQYIKSIIEEIEAP